MINTDSMRLKLKELKDYVESHPKETEKRMIEEAWERGYQAGWFCSGNDDFSSNPKIQREYDLGNYKGFSDRMFEVAFDTQDIEV